MGRRLINTFAGRTFNNPDMFPIFPSIVADAAAIAYVSYFTCKTGIAQELQREVIASDKNINAKLFFDPAIPGALPQWASDGYGFVYKLGKLLESQSTSKILPMWIDNVFGK